MTPTRNANLNGPALRDAHRRIGLFLAIRYMSELVGLEEYMMPHVQGHPTRLVDFGCVASSTT